jgi:hypothetical protein
MNKTTGQIKFQFYIDPVSPGLVLSRLTNGCSPPILTSCDSQGHFSKLQSWQTIQPLKHSNSGGREPMYMNFTHQNQVPRSIQNLLVNTLHVSLKTPRNPQCRFKTLSLYINPYAYSYFIIHFHKHSSKARSYL